MTGTGNEDRIELPFSNRPIEVHVHEIQPRRRAEVTEQTRLDVRRTKRLAQQWIVEQVDLAYRQVVGGTPVAVERGELPGEKRGSRGSILRGVRLAAERQIRDAAQWTMSTSQRARR